MVNALICPESVKLPLVAKLISPVDVVTPDCVYVTPLMAKLTAPSVRAPPSIKLIVPTLAASVCIRLP